MGRKSKQFEVPRSSVLIAVEGRSTEHEYFKRLGEIEAVKEHFDIVIYPDIDEKGTVFTDPLGLVDIAAKKGNGYDHKWVVIDRDGHANLGLAFDEARRNKVHIAFSHIAFEVWLLLHFERNATPFKRADCKDSTTKRKSLLCGTANPYPGDCTGKTCVAGYLRTNQWLPDYGKDRRTARAVAEKILQEPQLTLALQNAAWVRAQHQSIRQTHLWDLNPYTDVDRLVRFLLNTPEEYHWGTLGKPFLLPKKFALTVTQNPGTLCVSYENLSGGAVLFNQANFPAYFRCEDANGNPVQLDFPPVQHIDPGNTANLMMPIQSGQQPILLRFIYEHHHLLIPLI